MKTWQIIFVKLIVFLNLFHTNTSPRYGDYNNCWLYTHNYNKLTNIRSECLNLKLVLNLYLNCKAAFWIFVKFYFMLKLCVFNLIVNLIFYFYSTSSKYHLVQVKMKLTIMFLIFHSKKRIKIEIKINSYFLNRGGRIGIWAYNVFSMLRNICGEFRKTFTKWHDISGIEQG